MWRRRGELLLDKPNPNNWGELKFPPYPPFVGNMQAFWGVVKMTESF